MNRHTAALAAGALVLLGGIVWFAWILLTPSANVMDLSPQERSGYPQAENMDSGTPTATSSPSCAEFTVYNCPTDRWQTYRHSAGFEFKYPLAENLKSTGDEVRIDLGYPRAMRFKLTVLTMGLSEATRRLDEYELFRRYGGDKRSATVAGQRALTVSDAEDAVFGWLTYIELDSERTIAIVADFTEDFDSDQRLFGEMLASFRSDA